MSFLSEKSAPQLIGSLVLALVILLIARSIAAGGIEEYFNPKKQVENEVVDFLATQPANLAALRAIETHFPYQYDDLLSNITDIAVETGSQEAVLGKANQEIGRFLSAYHKDFEFAPEPTLEAALAAETQLLLALSDFDTTACTDYMFGTLQIVDPLSEEIEALIGEAVAKKVAAMAAGRQNQQMRLPSVPGDINALSDQLRADGATDGQIAMLLGEGEAASLTSDEQCDAAIRLLKAVGSLKGDRRATLTGELLAP